MKVIRWITISLIILLLGLEASSVGAFQSTGNQSARPSRLEEVLSIGSLQNDWLLQWVGVTVDREGFIYVTDSLDYSLKKFDAYGKLLKKAGGRGQGPGEFMAPRMLEFSEEFLFATDQILPGIQVFDSDLNFVSRIPILKPISDLKILGADWIIIAPFSPQGEGRLCVYDRKGNTERILTIQSASQGMLMEHFSFDCDEEMNFYLAYTFLDRLEKIDSQGKRIWEKQLFGTKKAKTKKIADYSLPVEVFYKDVALDNLGNVFLLTGSFTKNPGRDIIILDSQGREISTLTLPDSSHCIFIDDTDHLYARADAGITLKKYKIHYDLGLN